MSKINFAAVDATSGVALWASHEAIEALSKLQEQLKDQPESPEKIAVELAMKNAIATALELAINNAIAGHQNSIEKFDELQEAIGLFQLEVED